MMSDWEFKLAMHHKLNEMADLVLRHYDPCQMKNGGAACLAGDPNPCCIRTRFKRWDSEDKRCYFLGEKGCTFLNLECKVWLCPIATEQAGQECVDALKAIQTLGKMFGVSE